MDKLHEKITESFLSIPGALGFGQKLPSTSTNCVVKDKLEYREENKCAISWNLKLINSRWSSQTTQTLIRQQQKQVNLYEFNSNEIKCEVKLNG